MPAWWKKLPRDQRLLLGFGVPAVAVAALVSILRGRKPEEAPAEGAAVGGIPLRPLAGVGEVPQTVVTAPDTSEIDYMSGYLSGMMDMVGSFLGEWGGFAQAPVSGGSSSTTPAAPAPAPASSDDGLARLRADQAQSIPVSSGGYSVGGVAIPAGVSVYGLTGGGTGLVAQAMYQGETTQSIAYISPLTGARYTAADLQNPTVQRVLKDDPNAPVPH